ncbi:MAG: hypothetical protein RLZZ142_1797 [Verrucomicrobiota bacterium]|jgi:hypothetical protein
MNASDMQPEQSAPGATSSGEALCSELLVLPDGTVFAHHLTPILAEALAGILLPSEEVGALERSLETPAGSQPPLCL